MHTFVGPKGTVIDYNSDGSGPAVIGVYTNGAGAHTHDVPCADLLAFADHVRGHEDGGTDQEEQLERERVAFIRQAVAQLLASDPARLKVKSAKEAAEVADMSVHQAVVLWDALQRAGC